MAKTVLGGDREPRRFDPSTGFYRDGCCHTGAGDGSAHVVCARVTAELLEFAQEAGTT